MKNIPDRKAKLTKFLSSIPFERYVGYSGLAVISAASLLAFLSPTSPSTVAALGTYLSGLGLNVLAGVLQSNYQNLITSKKYDDDAKLRLLAKRITKDIKKDARLRIEIGEYLGNFDSLQIAEEIVKGNPAIHGWLLSSIYQDVRKYGTELDAIKEIFESGFKQIIAGQQFLIDAAKRRKNKSLPQNFKKSSENPLTPYSLLPFEMQGEAITQDLTKIIEEKNGAITPHPVEPDQFHVTLPIRSNKFVLKLMIVRKCTLKGEAWNYVRRIWLYEHGVLLIAMGSVTEKSFPPIFPMIMPQHSLTEWGWFTIFNLPLAKSLLPRMEAPLPRNTKESSFFCFTFSQVRNRQILKNKFNALLEFLGADDDNYARIQLARSSMNMNLTKWLDEGWLIPTENTAYVGFKKPPRKLKKNEVFMGNEIRKYEHIKVFEILFKQILKLQK